MITSLQTKAIFAAYAINSAVQQKIFLRGVGGEVLLSRPISKAVSSLILFQLCGNSFLWENPSAVVTGQYDVKCFSHLLQPQTLSITEGWLPSNC